MPLRPAAAALLLVLALPSAGTSQAARTRAADSLAARVTALADEYVREFVARFPESAEGNGMSVARHDGLSDNSPAAGREWDARVDAWAAAAARMDGGALWGRPEWVTFGMLREALEASRGRRVCRQELWPVSQLTGWQADFAELAGTQPVGTPELREQALARWRRVPRFLDTEVANLREGVRLGYTTPRRNVELVIGQLDALLATPTEESPFYAPARRDSAPEFRAAWRALLERELAPAVRRYRDYLRDEYRAAAREAAGVSANPDGAACYRALFRGYTTLDRAPEETAELGRARVARNRAEAEALAEEMGLYTVPGARITRRIWPARGMVVDPGIHVMGWTREQAVRYIMEAGRGREEAESMVDRIAVLPGQLTAYDTGGLEVFALRERAERELRDKFDVRDFHDAVLGRGAVTLPMLREAVDRWIASRK